MTELRSRLTGYLVRLEVVEHREVTSQGAGMFSPPRHETVARQLLDLSTLVDTDEEARSAVISNMVATLPPKDVSSEDDSEDDAPFESSSQEDLEREAASLGVRVGPVEVFEEPGVRGDASAKGDDSRG